MNTNQTWQAINSLIDASLKTDVNYKWYVCQSIEVGGDGLLSGLTGRGLTPEGAISDHWRLLTTIPENKYLVVKSISKDRKHYRWNKFMWQEQEPKK